MKKVKVIIIILLVFLLSSCGIKVTLQTSKSDVKNIKENTTQVDSKNTNVPSIDIENVKKQLGTLENQLANTSDKDVILKCLEDFKEKSGLKSSDIYFGNETGNLYVFPIVQLPNGYDPRIRPWYEGAKENGEYVSDPYVDFSTNNKILSVSKAIYKGKELIGVVSIDLVIENDKKISFNTSNKDLKNTPESNVNLDSNSENMSSKNIENVKHELETLGKELAATNEKDIILKCLEDFKEKSSLKSSAIYFGNEGGNFYVIPVVQLSNDYDPRKRPWYEGAKKDGVYVSDVYEDPIINIKLLSVSKAIYKDKELIGVVSIDLDVTDNEKDK